MSKQTINNIENELYKVIVAFENKVKKIFSDKNFLNQKMISCWEKELENLHFKLCVFNESELMGEKKHNLVYVDYEGKHNVDTEVQDINDAEEWLKREYKDKHVKTVLTHSMSHAGNDELLGVYQVLIALVYDKEGSESFFYFVSVMLDFLKNSITNLKYLEEMADSSDWTKFVDNTKFNFIQWYRDEVFKSNIPNVDVITKIAFLTYENRQNYGTFILVKNGDWEKLTEGLDGVLKISKVSQVGFSQVNDTEKGPEKMIRKMLETCNQNEESKRFLIVNATEPYNLLGIVTKEVFEKTMCNLEYCAVDYLGFGDWKLRAKEEVLLVYDKGRFKLEEEQSKQIIEDKVKEIEGLDESNQKSFENMLGVLQNQSHGALMVVASDAKTEAERLCAKYRKGTLIEEIDFKKKENLSLLDGIACVDGAVLVNCDGICYGFSVILDGEAKVQGDIGKGSRFNSSVNYVANKSRSAIIISEDKATGIKVENGKSQKSV